MRSRFIRDVGLVLSDAADLIYPDALYCIACGKVIDDSRRYRLCNDCMSDIRWATGRTCSKCGKILAGDNEGTVCRSCKEHGHLFDVGITCAEYGRTVRSVIFALKYSGRTDIAKTVAEIMANRLEFEAARGGGRFDIRDTDILIPVPMFGRKEAAKGFNQTQLIAEELCRRLGRDICRDDVVKRVRETQAMRGLAPAERRANISGAFNLTDEDAQFVIRGRSIAVLDDIYTSGATADEMAGLLKENGATRVAVVTFAAGADVIKEL